MSTNSSGLRPAVLRLGKEPWSIFAGKKKARPLLVAPRMLKERYVTFCIAVVTSQLAPLSKAAVMPEAFGIWPNAALSREEASVNCCSGPVSVTSEGSPRFCLNKSGGSRLLGT
jgi:hypothetical protein